MFIAILWPLSSLFALFLGFWAGAAFYDIKGMKKAFREFNEKMSQIPEDSRKTTPEEAKSVIIDPTDLGQQVKMEQEEMMRKLNPEIYDDLHEL